MKDVIIQNKGTITDGTLVLAGGFVSMLNDQIPTIIGLLTAILLCWRIVLAVQEFIINRKILKDDK